MSVYVHRKCVKKPLEKNNGVYKRRVSSISSSIVLYKREEDECLTRLYHKCKERKSCAKAKKKGLAVNNMLLYMYVLNLWFVLSSKRDQRKNLMVCKAIGMKAVFVSFTMFINQSVVSLTFFVSTSLA